MECHDAQQLLAFVNRPSEELDAPERVAIGEHLAKCPDCQALAQAERRADDLIGAVLRDVPVPAHLKQNLLGRLSAIERRQARWAWAKGAALAAAILIACTAALAWHFQPRPEASLAELRQIALQNHWDRAAVEQYLADEGVVVRVPKDLFDYRFFQKADVVRFHGRWVAQLSFARLEFGQTATAHVLILSPQQFNVNELKHEWEERGTTSLRIHHENGFVYVIFYTGNLAWLQGDPGT